MHGRAIANLTSCSLPTEPPTHDRAQQQGHGDYQDAKEVGQRGMVFRFSLSLRKAWQRDFLWAAPSL